MITLAILLGMLLGGLIISLYIYVEIDKIKEIKKKDSKKQKNS